MRLVVELFMLHFLDDEEKNRKKINERQLTFYVFQNKLIQTI